MSIFLQTCPTFLQNSKKNANFSTKLNFNFWTKFVFLNKISIVDQSFNFWRKCLCLTKISIFEQTCRFLATISIFFKLNVDFWVKFQFLNTIFLQNYTIKKSVKSEHLRYYKIWSPERSGQVSDVLRGDFASFIVSKISDLVSTFGASVSVVDDCGNAIIHKLIGVMCYTSENRLLTAEIQKNNRKTWHWKYIPGYFWQYQMKFD